MRRVVVRTSFTKALLTRAFWLLTIIMSSVPLTSDAASLTNGASSPAPILGNQNDQTTSVSLPSERAPPRTINDAPVDLLPPTIIGRQTELEFILDTFSGSASAWARCCVVYGKPGVGKTTLALEYARVSFDMQRHSHIFWTSGSSIDKLMYGLTQILDLIGHPDRYHRDYDSKLSFAIQWLENDLGYHSPDWLLVVDDVHRGVFEFLQDRLPRWNHRGKILFTAREQDLSDFLDQALPGHGTLPFQLHPLSNTRELFFSNSDIKEDDISTAQADELKNLCSSLGGSSLSIVQIASQSFNDCDGILERYRTKPVSEEGSVLTTSENELVTAVSTKHLEWLRGESLDVSNLLMFLSLLDPEDIPVEMIVDGAKRWLQRLDERPPPSRTGVKRGLRLRVQRILRRKEPPDYSRKIEATEIHQLSRILPEFQSLVNIINSPTDLQLSLQRLRKLSFIQIRSTGASQSVRMHNLTHTTTRESAKDGRMYREWLQCSISLICLAFERVEDPESRQWWHDCEKFMPHLWSLRDAWNGQTVPGASLPLASADLAIARYLNDRERNTLAEKLCRRALHDYEIRFGSEHPATLLSIHLLGRIHMNQRRYHPAQTETERALNGRMKCLGPSHKQTLDSMNNLGLIYRYLDRHAESEDLFTRMLAIEEKKLGSSDRDTLSTMENLAGLYEMMGRYAEAEVLRKRDVEGHSGWVGARHPLTALAEHRLALLYNFQKRYDASEELFVRALETTKRQLGSDHPWTMYIVDSLDDLYTEENLVIDVSAICN